MVDGSESEEHPLSIAAGIEKGHLNRYRNMFPVSLSFFHEGITLEHASQYEHSRCRLSSFAPNDTDYINASHIRLRGAERHYIATQGPVEPAYAHFWQLVVQENVSVIVMLTHFHEGGREKCGNYFRDGRYGPITVRTKMSGDGHRPPSPSRSAAPAGFFEVTAPQPMAPRTPGASLTEKTHGFDLDRTLKRTLLVVHDDDPPGQPPREILHVQYIAWPDFDVPPDIEEVLKLVEDLKAVPGGDAEHPILAHCSAGVGRTGCEYLDFSSLYCCSCSMTRLHYH